MATKIIAAALLCAASASASAQQQVTVPFFFSTSVGGRVAASVFDFTYQGGSFSFQSYMQSESTWDFRQGCAIGPGSGTKVEVRGLLAGASVFSFSAAVSCQPDTFQSMTNTVAPDAIVDELTFTVPNLSGVRGTDLVITTAVPEPETWALLLLGLALVHRRAMRPKPCRM